MLKKVLIAFELILGVFILGIFGYIVIIFAGDLMINKQDLVMDTASKIVDENGHTISSLFIENRKPVSIDQIPKHVQEAFVSAEDTRFYKHHGIDVRGIFRALGKDILTGSKAQGGSTITQQLAKRVFLTSQKSVFRKVKEMIIALTLERRYSKPQILEMYLNQAYFGEGAYGIQAASKYFFNKDVSDLTVEEGATLAALMKSPVQYSPVAHPKQSLERRNLILSLMAKQGYISPQEAVRLKGKTLGLNIEKKTDQPEYYTYIDMVLDEAKKKYHLSNREVLTGGYKIVVPMDIEAQKASYERFKDNKYFRGSNPHQSPQGAFVLMDPKTGGVMAVQGGRDYVRKGLNRVDIKRQPASTFKPLAVYGPALDSGKYQPYSLLTDKKITYHKYHDYTPTNYNHVYTGKMTMYDALTISANAPAVWLLNQMGVDYSKQYLDKLGLRIPDRGLAIALGGLKEGVTPLQLTEAFSSFPNNGTKVKPYFIQAIYDSNGDLVAHAKTDTTKVFRKQTAWYMTEMLRNVVKNGTGKQGHVNTALAGKTGSTAYGTKGLGNAWFAGYTPRAVGAVWIGYDKTTKEQYLTGGSGDAAMLFKDIINDLPDQQNLSFHKPSGVDSLDTPIRLGKITDLRADGTIGHMGLPAVKLTWTPLKDDRVVYHIYQMKDGTKTQIGEVTGKGEFVADYINPLHSGSFEVVPYNPQTKHEGKPSSKEKVDWVPKFLRG